MYTLFNTHAHTTQNNSYRLETKINVLYIYTPLHSHVASKVRIHDGKMLIQKYVLMCNIHISETNYIS